MVFLALIPILGGVLTGWGGYLGWRGRIPRDRGTGVRTWATLRSDEAFRVGNKVAGLPTMTAGGVGVVAGGAAFLMPDTLGILLAVGLGVLGMIALTGAGGMLGHRAATTVSDPAPAGGCGGCACGTGGCGAG
ncbi:SdpI/YhfL protein family protein [Haloechinothrix alba]|uniref:SdpI/YhfL protein family protein n=1 Tax=Haloechinothrix alba TaxID=664784 RepID=A0A238V0V4_9PSEU|nr:SdpI family protein [Haloechinothrix alba]SNR27647.1 SdpI/YhfL protein family protein [Haloechinothrix alba]